MFRTFAAAFVLLFVLSGCQCDTACQHYRSEEKKWFSDNGKIKVLSTTAMIDDIVSEIGGDHIDSLTLIRGELDPHTYQLVKGDDEKFAQADVIFYNGLGLEHGPSIQKQLSQNKNAIPLGDRVKNEFPNLILSYNNQIDPHIWMDIHLWSKIIPHIKKKLSESDPEHAADYEHNARELERKLASAHQEIRGRIHSIPQERRYLVTSHDAFNYFARAYLATPEEIEQNQWQARFSAPEGLAPESQLSATDIQIIIDHMKQYRIEVIFPESNVSQDSVRKVAQAGQENGVKFVLAEDYLYGDAMGPPGSDGDTYLKMIDHNARVLVQYLKEEL